MRSLKSESDIVLSSDANKGNIENNLGPLKKKRRKKSKITLPLAPPIATHKDIANCRGPILCWKRINKWACRYVEDCYLDVSL